jgi:hypothetical protein
MNRRPNWHLLHDCNKYMQQGVFRCAEKKLVSDQVRYNTFIIVKVCFRVCLEYWLVRFYTYDLCDTSRLNDNFHLHKMLKGQERSLPFISIQQWKENQSFMGNEKCKSVITVTHTFRGFLTIYMRKCHVVSCTPRTRGYQEESLLFQAKRMILYRRLSCKRNCHWRKT